MKLFKHEYTIDYLENNTGITTNVVIDLTISCKPLMMGTILILVYEYIQDELFDGFPPSQHPTEPNEGITMEYFRSSQELEEMKDYLQNCGCGMLYKWLVQFDKI